LYLSKNGETEKIIKIKQAEAGAETCMHIHKIDNNKLIYMYY